jgi:hypothetical protein
MNYTGLISRIIAKVADLYIRFRNYLLVLVVLVIATVNLREFLWTTQNTGVFVRTDSVAYLWSADNLINGYGIGRLDGGGNFVPYIHWPPLYPIALAGISLMGFSGLEAARWFGAACIVLSTILIGLMAGRVTRNSAWYALGILIILSNSSYYFETYYYAMSEPLYIVMSLSALLLLDCYFTRIKKIYLILASLFIGLTLVTRYVGIALLIACMLYLIVQSRAWRRKIMDILSMGFIALLPLGIWLIRNFRLTGIAANRTLSIYSISADEWTQAGNEIASWVSSILNAAPIGNLKPVVILFFAFVIGSLYFRFIAQNRDANNFRFTGLVGTYAVSYAVFVILARVMFDPDIPIYEVRIQYPLLISVLILAISLIHYFQSRIQYKNWIFSAFIGSVLVLTAWIFIHGYRGEFLTLTTIGHNAGFGLSRVGDVEFSSVLKQYPAEDYRYYSDDIEKLYFISSGLINSYSIYDKQPDEVKQLISETSNGRFVIVLFDQKDIGLEYSSALPGIQQVYTGIADVYVSP